jgi:hypothetical protein
MGEASTRFWPADDGVNLLGTPLSSPEFVESYLKGKGHKQGKLVEFVKEVAAAGFPREAVAMLTGAGVPRLTHILKTIAKDDELVRWFREMDSLHLSAWLHCLTGSRDLEHALDPEAKDSLGALLDLPPSYGGADLRSLERAADEEFLGSFGGITASLISFCRGTELRAYERIAEALEEMEHSGEEDEEMEEERPGGGPAGEGTKGLQQ